MSLQVAELIASILSNPDVSENKVIEAVATTEAPLRPIPDLLAALPTVGPTQAQRLQEARSQAKEAALREAEREAALEEQEQTVSAPPPLPCRHLEGWMGVWSSSSYHYSEDLSKEWK